MQWEVRTIGLTLSWSADRWRRGGGEMIFDDLMTDWVEGRRTFVRAGVTHILMPCSSRQNLGFNDTFFVWFVQKKASYISITERISSFPLQAAWAVSNLICGGVSCWTEGQPTIVCCWTIFICTIYFAGLELSPVLKDGGLRVWWSQANWWGWWRRPRQRSSPSRSCSPTASEPCTGSPPSPPCSRSPPPCASARSQCGRQQSASPLLAGHQHNELREHA